MLISPSGTPLSANASSSAAPAQAGSVSEARPHFYLHVHCHTCPRSSIIFAFMASAPPSPLLRTVIITRRCSAHHSLFTGFPKTASLIRWSLMLIHLALSIVHCSFSFCCMHRCVRGPCAAHGHELHESSLITNDIITNDLITNDTIPNDTIPNAAITHYVARSCTSRPVQIGCAASLLLIASFVLTRTSCPQRPQCQTAVLGAFGLVTALLSTATSLHGCPCPSREADTQPPLLFQQAQHRGRPPP